MTLNGEIEVHGGSKGNGQLIVSSEVDLFAGVEDDLVTASHLDISMGGYPPIEMSRWLAVTRSSSTPANRSTSELTISWPLPLLPPWTSISPLSVTVSRAAM